MINAGLVATVTAMTMVAGVSILADWNDIKAHAFIRKSRRARKYEPPVTVFMRVTYPDLVLKSLASFEQSTYVNCKIVIVVPETRSSDEYKQIDKYRKMHPAIRITIMTRGIQLDDDELVQRQARKGLVMFLREGSTVDPATLERLVPYFRDARLQAARPALYTDMTVSIEGGLHAGYVALANHFGKLHPLRVASEDILPGVMYRSQLLIRGTAITRSVFVAQAGVRGMPRELLQPKSRTFAVFATLYSMVGIAAVILSSPTRWPVVAVFLLGALYVLGAMAVMRQTRYRFDDKLALISLTPFVVAITSFMLCGYGVRALFRGSKRRLFLRKV